MPKSPPDLMNSYSLHFLLNRFITETLRFMNLMGAVKERLAILQPGKVGLSGPPVKLLERCWGPMY